MIAVKKIEVVVGAVELESMLQDLQRIGVTDWTIVHGVTGRGDRGVRDAGEVSDAFRSVLVTIACPPERAQPAVEAIRPYLKRYGGICLVSDAQWVRH